MVPEGTDKLSENDELREYELSGSDCTFFQGDWDTTNIHGTHDERGRSRSFW